MPPWRELRSRRVAVVAVAAALAVAVLTGAGVAAWQHRTLAFASPLTNTADLAASAGQQVDDQAQLASILTPVATYTVSARFGQRGAHWHTRHTGFDFVAPWGTPVRAIQEATVLKLAWNGAYGRMIILRLAPGVTAWYCHLSSVSVTEGEHVLAGQTIGRVGATGNVTGAHLHLEIRVHDRPTDPEIYLFGPDPGHPGPPAPWYPNPGLTLDMLQPLPHS